MRKLNIKELEDTNAYIERSKTLKTLTEQFEVIMSYKNVYCPFGKDSGDYKLYVNVERDKDDAINYKYLLKSHNERDTSNIIDGEVLNFKRCEYKISEPSVDDIFEKALEVIVRKYTHYLD